MDAQQRRAVVRITMTIASAVSTRAMPFADCALIPR